MALQIPDSMDDLVYFSRRNLAETKGKAIAWVPKLVCPKCKKGKMGKPVDPKTKKVMVRAKEYVCAACKYTEERAAHEQKLQAAIIYECPFCNAKGETMAPFPRKSFYGKKAIVFSCAKCNEKLGITKKLSTPPDFLAKVAGKPVGKKAAKEDVELDEDDDF